MVSLQKISKSFQARSLFKNLSFDFPENEKIALVGVNGCGKSTLLKILCKRESADDGQVVTSSPSTIGYLPQEFNLHPATTILEECIQGERIIADIQAKRDAALHKIAQYCTEEALEEYSHLENAYLQCGGYEIEGKAEKLLAHLGFQRDMFNRSPLDLSGGWRMRLELSRVLINNPDFLILDEPTNHMDKATVQWLQQYLKAFKGTIIFVAHDRSFINFLAVKILHLNGGTLSYYDGNYDSFVTQFGERQELIEATLKDVARKRDHLQSFVDRFGAKATKAKQAHSKRKMIDRLNKEHKSLILMDEPLKIKLRIKTPHLSSRYVLTLEHCNVGYTKPILKRVNLTVERGHKIAVLGPNGSGKSTLLKTVAGLLPYLGGEAKVGNNVEIGYYAQNYHETLVEDETVLSNVSSHATSLSEREVRCLLGALLIKDNAVFKPLKVLSGGEKSRVSLACLLALAPNFLLLDEPTNHLDLDSAQVLAGMLAEFKGTILFTSHNQHFVDTVATHHLSIEPDGTCVLMAAQ